MYLLILLQRCFLFEASARLRRISSIDSSGLQFHASLQLFFCGREPLVPWLHLLPFRSLSEVRLLVHAVRPALAVVLGFSPQLRPSFSPLPELLVLDQLELKSKETYT